MKKDELMHWKYIRKERKKGKWRYYYLPDALGLDEKKSYDDAADHLDQARARFAGEKISYNNLGKSTKDLPPYNAALRREMTNYYFNKTYSQYFNAGKRFTQARDNFYRTPVGVLYQASSAVKKSVDKAKRFLDSLFD